MGFGRIGVQDQFYPTPYPPIKELEMHKNILVEFEDFIVVLRSLTDRVRTCKSEAKRCAHNPELDEIMTYYELEARRAEGLHARLSLAWSAAEIENTPPTDRGVNSDLPGEQS